MSLTSAVILLQTALSLLTLVNSNPSLPQSMRDNAQQVAQQAIAQATDALKQNAAGQSATNTAAQTVGSISTASSSAPALPSNINSTADNASSATQSSLSDEQSLATYKPDYAQYGVTPDVWIKLGRLDLSNPNDMAYFNFVLAQIRGVQPHYDTLVREKNAVLQAAVGQSVDSATLASLPTDIQSLIQGGDREVLLLQAEILNNEIRESDGLPPLPNSQFSCTSQVNSQGIFGSTVYTNCH